MRRLVYKIQLFIILSAAIALVSCARNLSPNNPGNTNQNNMQETAGKYKFPDNPRKTGNGRVIVKAPKSNSENGDIAILVLQRDVQLSQIGVDLEDFDADKDVFLYIDKAFVDKAQAGVYSVNTINLTGNNLKTGDHVVSAVQFENNDPNGRVVQYSEGKYRIQQGT